MFPAVLASAGHAGRSAGNADAQHIHARCGVTRLSPQALAPAHEAGDQAEHSPENTLCVLNVFSEIYYCTEVENVFIYYSSRILNPAPATAFPAVLLTVLAVAQVALCVPSARRLLLPPRPS